MKFVLHTFEQNKKKHIIHFLFVESTHSYKASYTHTDVLPHICWCLIKCVFSTVSICVCAFTRSCLLFLFLLLVCFHLLLYLNICWLTTKCRTNLLNNFIVNWFSLFSCCLWLWCVGFIPVHVYPTLLPWLLRYEIIRYSPHLFVLLLRYDTIVSGFVPTTLSWLQ